MGAMLEIRSETKVIGEFTYYVQPLATGASLKVMARVLKMVAPAFGNVSSLAEAASAVGAMLSGVLAELDEATISLVCAEFAKVTRHERDNKKLPLSADFDTHFQGRIVDLFDWIRFASEVTYGPLAARLKAELIKPDAPAKPAEAAPAAG